MSLLQASDTALSALGKPLEGDVIDGDELATPEDATPELDLLRTEQRFALEDLLTGMSPADVARKNQMGRKTLYMWMNRDPAFKAALAACHRQATQLARDRLTLALSDAAAAATVAEAVISDPRAAAQLLKGCGLLPGPPRPPALPPTAPVPLAIVPPEKRRAFEIRLRELILSFTDEPADAATEPNVEHKPPEPITDIATLLGDDAKYVKG